MSTPLRRSAHIASKTVPTAPLKAPRPSRLTPKVVPSAPLKAPRPSRISTPTRMADVAIDMDEFMELFELEQDAPTLKEKRVAQKNYLEYLAQRPYLFDFLDEDTANHIRQHHL